MLRGFYGWLIETGFLNTNPFESVVRRKPITSSFFHIDTEAIQHLFEIIGTDTWVGIRDRSMLGLLFNTGMRVSELLSIQLKDILWSENRVIIPGNGKPSRSCTLWEWVFDELYCFYQLRQNIDPGKVKQFFINHNGGPLTSRSIRRKFSAYGRRAGFSVPITPAVLRHSYAMLMLQNSVKPSIIKRQLGHRSSSSMRPYLECLKQQLSSHRVEVMV
jgi:integrase/recombinase XerC